MVCDGDSSVSKTGYYNSEPNLELISPTTSKANQNNNKRQVQIMSDRKDRREKKKGAPKSLEDTPFIFKPFVDSYNLVFHPNKEIAKRHAVYSAYLSILAALIEFVIAFKAGEDDDSSAVFGIAAMAIIEGGGSALVVWRWQFASPQAKKHDLDRIEAMGSLFIGMGMLVSVAMLLTSSFDGLVLHQTPDGETEAFEVSCFTALVGLFLFYYKNHVGKVLKSMVVIADAKSSLCSGLVALAVIVSEGLQEWIWCADDVMGILLSLYILAQAYKVIDGALAELRHLREALGGGGAGQKEGERAGLLDHNHDAEVLRQGKASGLDLVGSGVEGDAQGSGDDTDIPL